MKNRNQSNLSLGERSKDYHSYINHNVDFSIAKDKSKGRFSEGVHLSNTFHMVDKFDHMNSDVIKKNASEKLELKFMKKKCSFENRVFKEFDHKIEEKRGKINS